MSNEYYSPQGGGSFPPLYPPSFSAPVAKKKWWKRWWVWLIIGLVGCLFACSGSAFLVGKSLQDMMKDLPNSPAVKVANSYYAAIEKQDYEQAYSFLDAQQISINGYPSTKETYIKNAMVFDEQKEKVSSYSFSNIEISNYNGEGSAKIIVSVTRVFTYPVHLQLLEEYGVWKIVSIDGI